METEIYEKPGLGERFINFCGEHPAIGWTAYVGACVALCVPVIALYGRFVGRHAGRSAAKELLAAGVELSRH